MKNLLKNIPDDLPEELFETLVKNDIAYTNYQRFPIQPLRFDT